MPKKENDNLDVEKNTLDEIIKAIEKRHGKGSIVRLGDKPSVDVDVIPSGSLMLDEALGVGGYPKGRIIEIFGPESSGKTTLALHAIAEAQKKGGSAAFIDAEHSIDPNYASALGVDIDNLILAQPDSGEEALEICEALATSGEFSLIVIDSVAALVPQAELEGVMSDNQVGMQARLMSKALRKIAGVLNKTGTIVIFINQLREKVGVLYGNPETTTGGRALKFYASIRIDIRRADAIKNGSEITGNTVKIKIVKNKVAVPFKSCMTDIIYGEGISKIAELLVLAEEKKVVRRSGAWFEYDGNKIGQGKEQAKRFLSEHPDIAKDIENKVLNNKLNKSADSVETEEELTYEE